MRERMVVATGLLIVSTLVGSLFFNPYDVPSYVWISNGVIKGQNIYTAQDPVPYPPLLYIVGGGIIYSIETATSITIVPGRNQMVSVAIFAGLAVLPLIISWNLGNGLLARDTHREWVFATLVSPLAISVVLLHGQMTGWAVLGIVGVIYAIRTDHHLVGGLALALGASVKIYPVLLALPYLYRCRSRWRQIVIGASPVIIINSILFILWFPGSLSLFELSQSSIRPINLLHILAPSLSIPTIDLVFKLAFVSTSIIAAVAPTDDDVAIILPLFAVTFLYVDMIEYRWLAIAVPALFVGLIGSQTVVRHRMYILGWTVTGLATIGMVLGQLTGLIIGIPWWELTIGTWPALPVSLTPRLLTNSRQVITAILFILSVWTVIPIVTDRLRN